MGDEKKSINNRWWRIVMYLFEKLAIWNDEEYRQLQGTY